jgi:meiotically up-regulated gene 157 (Mug157) protein
MQIAASHRTAKQTSCKGVPKPSFPRTQCNHFPFWANTFFHFSLFTLLLNVRHEELSSMGRLQQRRARFAALSAVISFILLIWWYKDTSDIQGVVTWSGSQPHSSTSSEEGSEVQDSVTEKPTLLSLTGFPESTTLPALQDPEKAGYIPTAAATALQPGASKECMQYEALQMAKQEPLSAGKRKFPYSRPDPHCRNFQIPAMENLLERMKGVIKDPDLFRLFENSYPNTLDTMIKWRGYANKTDPETKKTTVTDEELAYVITGDIDAMWLRDSASQIYSYFPLLEASTSPDSLASLWRGLINSHSRYIIISPYCHSFQPPTESGIKPSPNGAFSQNNPQPPYDPLLVFDCKWELDSLASFLQISSAYYEKTKDIKFFSKYTWISAVKAAVDAAGAMRLGTYAADGKVEKSAWTFTGWTNRGSETLTNDGLGNPTKSNGMIRSAFRPSDDACIFQLLVPANMMFAKYLEEASLIMTRLPGSEAANLTTVMREMAFGIRKGIDRDAIVHHREFGDVFAYEVDGYGGANLMDDANVPSLLSIPLFDYFHSSFPLPNPAKGDLKRNYQQIYKNTRSLILSPFNPYWSQGPSLSAIGGPHLGPGKGWPMAAIVRALGAFEIGLTEKELKVEVRDQLAMVLNSTAGTGVVHESVNSWNAEDWTRAWFGWANGLVGELVLRIEKEKGAWLGESWQD